MAIFRGQLSRGQLFGGRGGNCPGGSCPVPKIKSLFTIFEGLSVAKNCLKLESVPLRI